MRYIQINTITIKINSLLQKTTVCIKPYHLWKTVLRVKITLLRKDFALETIKEDVYYNRNRECVALHGGSIA